MITRDSLVTTADALRRQAREMTESFGGALIEEFVAGREFTVLVAENPDDPLRPTTYMPVEFLFPEGDSFKHFDLKWIEHGQVRSVPVVDELLDAQLRELAAKVFRGLNGAGFRRVDVRVDDEGRAFFLEINPNCGVYTRRRIPAAPISASGTTRPGMPALLGRSCVRR